MPVAPRASISFSASAARSSGNRAPTSGRTNPFVHQAGDRGADLAHRVGLAHHAGSPAGADHLGVVQQQAVDPDLGDRAAREPDDDHAAALAQRPEVVGEAIAADGVDHDVHAAAGDLLDLVLPGTVRANDLVGAGIARDPLLVIARHHGDRACAQPLGDLQRRRADSARRALHEHRLPFRQPAARAQREVGGVVVQHEAGALGEVELVGEREAEVLGRGDHLGKPAQPAERGHPVAGRDRGAVGRRADDAADLAAGDERQRRLELILAAGLQHLGERHAGGVDVDQHAASRSQHRASPRARARRRASAPRRVRSAP